ncbi:Arsenate reductase, glutaredoxin family [Pseudorhodobacter antarcticus]|jgi:arsenate reductase-like glutaredoxin family protein|uniref:Arsenate reductase, glutaredoxin family n=1 Tax=Pseudorhodobacter antarcticus TaxID=1077947 RepID=A0A1H8G1P0_9RHOB|nr:ArsC/Spx/MgsR family protein [Pseudorhodobacter antarcticus]SEN37862.1 Arsenate reductase, glutaredoxin family [Pseudorhodobacter antarcticus]
MILYGISTCDTCKKALKSLTAAGHAPSFRDIRADPLTEAEITEFITEFGGQIINQKSTTWRAASDWLKASDADEQLKQQPTLMKRPVIRGDHGLTLGWDDAVMAKYL